MKLPTRTGHVLGSHTQICFRLISLIFGQLSCQKGSGGFLTTTLLKTTSFDLLISNVCSPLSFVCFSSFSIGPGLNNHHVLVLDCDRDLIVWLL